MNLCGLSFIGNEIIIKPQNHHLILLLK
ncbi:hypothetical protein [Proteus vulgaris]